MFLFVSTFSYTKIVIMTLSHCDFVKIKEDKGLLAGPVVKNLNDNAGDMSSIPAQEDFHAAGN